MVIQRTWKLQNNNESVHHSSNNSANNNSSDDSNGSSQTVSSSNTNSSKSQNIKYVTTTQMAENVLSKLHQRFGAQITGSSEAVMRSLELLRINVQLAFDKEIDSIVQKFMEVYFKPAFKNIKENLGDHIVSDDVLQKMSCALLENSKSQYNTRLIATKPLILPITIQNDRHTLIKHDSNITVSSLQTNSNQINLLKRPCDIVSNETTQTSKKPFVQYQTTPHYQSNSNSNLHQIQPRRQIFWNTANISTETKFLLDVQANQAFGFGTDGRERLASKHPELIRYLPDGQDRDWLVSQKIIPEQNRNSRFLFLIYDEVMKLGQSDLYRNRENLNLQILHAFKIPNFIIQKMKIFFIDLNIKSRGLITNSYSAIVGGSQLRNALLQGSQNVSNNCNNNSNNGQNDNNTNNNCGNNLNNANIVNNGTASTNTIANANCISSSTGNNSIIITTTTPITNNDVASVSTTTNTDRPKMKSTLSSSHATLTALLTNNNENAHSSAGGDSG